MPPYVQSVEEYDERQRNIHLTNQLINPQCHENKNIATSTSKIKAVEPQKPTHNSAMDAICAIASQSRGCKWAIGSSGCSSIVECPHKRHQ